MQWTLVSGNVRYKRYSWSSLQGNRQTTLGGRKRRSIQCYISSEALEIRPTLFTGTDPKTDDLDWSWMTILRLWWSLFCTFCGRIALFLLRHVPVLLSLYYQVKLTWFTGRRLADSMSNINWLWLTAYSNWLRRAARKLILIWFTCPPMATRHSIARTTITRTETSWQRVTTIVKPAIGGVTMGWRLSLVTGLPLVEEPPIKREKARGGPTWKSDGRPGWLR